MDECFQGFEHVKRYWDGSRDKSVAKILPGEYYVTKNLELITTVLGSCVAVCIRDEISKIGGMNHFMLPLQNKNSSVTIGKTNLASRYGNWAMEHLINDIIKFGGDKTRLEIKVFGGGAVMEENIVNNIGDKNIKFVNDYLKSENMVIAAQDVGGKWARKVVFDPLTGEVLLKRFTEMHNQTITSREQEYLKTIKSTDIDGEVELFND